MAMISLLSPAARTSLARRQPCFTPSAIRPGWPARVGMWGLSEGSWVAEIGAARSPEVAFLVLVGGSGVSPAQQTSWAVASRLHHVGVSGPEVHTISVTALRLLAGAGLFPEANHDPVPVIENIHQPVLAMWGALDHNSPPDESSRIIRQALEKGGNAHYTIRFFTGAQHDLHGTLDGFVKLDALTPGYTNIVGSWVNGLAAGLPPGSAQPAPHQQRESSALVPEAWYQSTWAQLAAIVLLIAAFTSYLLVALVSRLRGRRSSLAVRWPARVLAGAGLVATMGCVGYSVVTFVSLSPGPILAGRALVWLVLQVLAVTATVAAVATGIAWWRRRAEVVGGNRVGLSLLLAAGVLFLPWAAHWGLLAA